MRYLVWVFIILLSSCDECRNNDCANNATLKFKIVDQDENNLLLISDQKYSFESLQIAGIEDGETIQLNSINRTDFVEVPLTTDQTSIVISYGGIESDTLDISNKQYNQDDCCGTILKEFSIKLKENLLCRRCSTIMAVIEKSR